MNTNTQPLALKKGPSTLARAKFGPGMLLQHDDLEQMNIYTRELNRLMFRSLFGCGVVCGLVVDAKMNCGKLTVTVGGGLALDCQGDPIYVPQSQSLVLDEECDPNIPTPLWVVLCGTEKCCAPRTSMCASDEDESSSVCTRERDYFEIRIVRTRPKCTCSCSEPDPQDQTQVLLDDKCKCVNPEHKCYVDHYAGKCGCDCEDFANSDCDCVLLARLDKSGDGEHPVWTPDHRVRRFVRPVLMRDPQVWIEEDARQMKEKGTKYDHMDECRDAAPGVKQQPEEAKVKVKTGTQGRRRETTTQGSAETEILKPTSGRDHG